MYRRWYGLVAARTYLRLRPAANVLIIDSDNSVGGVWSKDRLYPNLVAQVQLGLFNYSDTPMPPYEGNPKDPRVTGEMIHTYLQTYAEDHDLIRRIRFNTFISRTEQTARGWRLAIQDSDERIETEKLLVATGVTSIPYTPAFEGAGHDPGIPIIHSRDIGTSFDALQDEAVEHVVVVGAAKSAYDVVYLLLSQRKRVTWIIRSDGAGPLAILPFRILKMVNSIAVASTRLMTHLSPSILNTHGRLYWFFQRTLLGQWLVGLFWTFLDFISSVHAGYRAGDHVHKLRPEIDRQSKNLTIIRDQISFIKDHDVRLKTGSKLQADFAVMCTGWGDHFGIFDAAQKSLVGLPAYNKTNLGPGLSLKTKPGVDGALDWALYDQAADVAVDTQLPFLSKPPKLKHSAFLGADLQQKWRLYRRAVPVDLALRGDRSLAILGQIHTVQTPLVAEVQSFWAILYLLGDVTLPDASTMAGEVARWNAWTRKRYLNQGQKFPYALYDFLSVSSGQQDFDLDVDLLTRTQYVDALFADLGLSSRRKSNPIAELLSPYAPADFNGFVDEYLAARDGAGPRGGRTDEDGSF
ncbi:putative flavin-binding monooxygenase-like family protein [Diplocarpon rosae]|nr:putative flavin-binding monooxygenase-like family protein [Diplocarpon rosae]